MSVACSCKRNTYSKWRLDVLQELYGGPLPNARPRLLFLHPQFRGSSRRCASSKGTATSDANPIISSGDAAQVETGTTARKQSLARRKGARDPNSAANTGDDSRTSVEKCTVPTQRGRKAKFDPYSKAGRADLQAALDSLKNLYKSLEKSKKFTVSSSHTEDDLEDEFSYETTLRESHKPRIHQSRPPQDSVPDDTTTTKFLTPTSDRVHPPRDFLPEDKQGKRHKRGHRSFDLPQSPLLAHLEDRSKRFATSKLRPPPGGQEPLRDNVWAQMLASPVRQCVASSARVPVDLLTRWNFIENDKDGFTYILPSSLADTSSIWRLGAEKGYATSKKGLRAQKHDAVQEASSVDSDRSSDIQQFQPLAVPATVNLLPHLNLMRLITVQLTKLDSMRTFLSPSKGAAQKIIPVHVKTQVAQMMHYERQRAIVERKTSMPSTVKVPEDAIRSFNDVSWDPMVAGRLVRILRKRVSAALLSTLHLNAKRDPDAGLQRIDILPAGLDDPSTWAPPSAATESNTPSSSSNQNTHSPLPPTDNTDDPAGPLPYSNKSKPLEAALFLYVGPYPHPLFSPTNPHTTVSPASAPQPTTTTPYLPPTLPISHSPSATRVPIFPLLPLLGEYHTATFRKDLAALLSPKSHHLRSKATKHGNINLNLIPPTSHHTRPKAQKHGNGNLDVLQDTTTTTTTTNNNNTTSNAIPNGTNTDSAIAVGATVDATIAHIQANKPFTLLFRNATRYRPVLEKEIWRLWRYFGGREMLEFWADGADPAADVGVGVGVDGIDGDRDGDTEARQGPGGIDMADIRVWGDPRLLKATEERTDVKGQGQERERGSGF